METSGSIKDLPAKFVALPLGRVAETKNVKQQYGVAGDTFSGRFIRAEPVRQISFCVEKTESCHIFDRLQMF